MRVSAPRDHRRPQLSPLPGRPSPASPGHAHPGHGCAHLRRRRRADPLRGASCPEHRPPRGGSGGLAGRGPGRGQHPAGPGPGPAGERDRGPRPRRRAARRRGAARPALDRALHRGTPGAVPGRVGCRHAVRGCGRAPGLPLLRRARVQVHLGADREGAAQARRPGQRPRARRGARGPAPQGALRRDRGPPQLPGGAGGRSAGLDQRGDGGRRPGPHLVSRGEAGPARLRATDRAGSAPDAPGLLRAPLRVRQARPGRHPRLRGRSDGERRPHHLSRAGPAARPGHCSAVGAEAGGGGRHPRAGPPVVRQLGHDGLVGRPLAQRGLCHLDGVQDRRPLASGLAGVARLRRRQGDGAAPGRAQIHPSHPWHGGERQRGHRELRRHHLREGRRGPADD